MKAFSACIFVAAMVAMASAAPTPGVDAKSLAAPLVPLTAFTHQESSFDKGAQQASSSSGQGSHSYDHGAQASKTFGNKESSGLKENFLFASNNAFNQGSGQFSHSGGFNNNGHLAHFGTQQQSLTALPAAQIPNRIHVSPVGVPGLPQGVPPIPAGVLGVSPVSLGVPGVSGSVTGVPIASSGLSSGGASLGASLGNNIHPGAGFGNGVIFQPLSVGLTPFGASSSAGSLQSGSAASGFAQGQGAWSYNQGQSSVNSSGNKETFSNKESFGQESSAASATGAGQNSHAQSAQSAQHEKGHQLASNTEVVG